MKPNRFLFKATGIFLVLSAFATANVALAENKKGEKHNEVNQANIEKKDAEKGEVLEKGKPHEVRLSNLSNMPLLNIDIRLSGKDSADFSQTNNCGSRLGQRESCVIKVTFTPKTTGKKTAMVEVHTSVGERDVALTGTGI